MRVIVFGGREYNGIDVDLCLTYFHEGTLILTHEDKVMTGPITCVIHGNAKGADRKGKDWAIEEGVKHRPYPADWDNIDAPGAVIKHNIRTGKPYNAVAGHWRNEQMARESNADLAFMAPGGQGTRSMRNKCKLYNIPVYLVEQGKWAT